MPVAVCVSGATFYIFLGFYDFEASLWGRQARSIYDIYNKRANVENFTQIEIKTYKLINANKQEACCHTVLGPPPTPLRAH